MRKRFHNSIVAILVLTVMLLGFQSVSVADAPHDGVESLVMNVSPLSPDMSDHQCNDCDHQDCCASPDCQAAPHCLSYSTMASSSALSLALFAHAEKLHAPDVVVASLLIPSIYRPPWA